MRSNVFATAIAAALVFLAASSTVRADQPAEEPEITVRFDGYELCGDCDCAPCRCDDCCEHHRHDGRDFRGKGRGPLRKIARGAARPVRRACRGVGRVLKWLRPFKRCRRCG